MELACGIVRGLILLYKASDTSVSGAWCGYKIRALISLGVRAFAFTLLFWLYRGPAYLARATGPTTAGRSPLFTAKSGAWVGGEYMVEGSLENADIWRAIKAGQG